MVMFMVRVRVRVEVRVRVRVSVRVRARARARARVRARARARVRARVRIAPLDLHSPHFYRARQPAIDARLASVAAAPPTRLAEMVREDGPLPQP